MSSARHEPKIVDAHHHRWDRQLHSYPWLAKPAVPGIAGDTTPLCRNYLVADFQADIGDLEVVRSMHIQAEIAHDLSLAETRWLKSLADAGPGFPHGIVIFADLSDPGVDALLAAHVESPNVRGIRQILNRHPDPKKTFVTRDYMAEAAWQQGFGRLAAHRLSFDMQLYWPQMAQARRHPDHPQPHRHADGSRRRWHRRLAQRHARAGELPERGGEDFGAGDD
jgi:predicted TIM-barrel fold metal-dependent hydrolase